MATSSLAAMKVRHLIPVWGIDGEVVGYVLRDGRSAPRPQTRGPRPEEEGPPRQAARRQEQAPPQVAITPGFFREARDFS